MTIVYFPNRIDFEFTAADLAATNGRSYLVASPPHRLVIVVFPSVTDRVALPDALVGGYYDCSLGDHAADAPIGYTLPQYSGQPHSKITIRNEVEPCDPDLTWDQVLAGCPITAEGQSDRVVGAWVTSIHVPDLLRPLIVDYCARRGISFSQAVWAWAAEELG